MVGDSRNVPSIGMNFAHEDVIKVNEYGLLFNGNITSVNNTFAKITNEQSNLLCTKFKPGFKVNGVIYNPSLNTTFFFIVNPETSSSEIGFILNSHNRDTYDGIAPCTTCDNKPVKEDTPLEELEPRETCQYTTWVSNSCLNFNIDYPITAWIKVDDANVRIYFNDRLNDLRYIDYPDFQKVVVGTCPVTTIDVLDCDKIKLFPQSDYPKVQITDIVSGGQNIAGTLQFVIGYSDVNSNKVTDYYYVTNPVDLYSKQIVDNSRIDYPVSKSVKLHIYDLNTDFRYFNLVVLKTVNGVTTPYLVDTFSVNGTSFDYTYTGNDKQIDLNLSIGDILGKRAFYTKAKGVTGTNGILLQYNLEQQRVLNFQPVVKDIPVKWQTVELEEGSYSNPIIANRYTGYLGDEVYAKGISFVYDNGRKSPVSLFVGREATSLDLLTVNNNDVIEASTCNDSKPNKRWQVYNTACIEGTPIPPNGNSNVSTPQHLDIDCLSDQFIFTIDLSLPLPQQPVFYKYPPSTAYPVTASNLSEYTAWINDPTNIIDPSEFSATPSNVGFCDCDSYGQILTEQGATDIVVVTENPNLIYENSNEDFDVSIDPQVRTINTYAGAMVDAPNATTYNRTPSPCNLTNDEYLVYLDQVINTTFDQAVQVAQSPTTSVLSGGETQGSWLTPTPSPQDFWYRFILSNNDGVAVVQISTDLNGSSGAGYTSSTYNVEVYNVNSNGTIGSLITSVVGHSGNYQYLLQGIQSSNYAIKLTGYYNYTDVTQGDAVQCKQLSYQLRVVTPNPTDTLDIQVAGSGRLIRTCSIDYVGFSTNVCEGTPSKFGKFAYVESEEVYPDNEEVWGDLACKPIRHFKYPDSSVVPFSNEQGTVYGTLTRRNVKIYPKGWVVDVADIKSALDNAVTLGLITQEEKLKIVGYRLYRGNRRGQESIIGKGLLYDVWSYKDNFYGTQDDFLTTNFPFNDNRDNEYIRTSKTNNKNDLNRNNQWKHPDPKGDGSKSNNKYTFDAPNLSFNDPGLGGEIKLEGEMRGVVSGSFNELKGNSVYQYLGPGVIQAALGFSAIEAAMEAIRTVLQSTLVIPATVLGSGSGIPVGLIMASIAENVIAPVRLYSHYSEWYDIIKKYAPFFNYGKTYCGVGQYSPVVAGNATEARANTRRAIVNAQYLRPGVLGVKTVDGVLKFNNFNRDSSVFLELKKGTYFDETEGIDTSRLSASCSLTGIGNLSSYYGSMKVYNPNQYGTVDSIEWIDCGYDGVIDWNNPNQSTKSDTIFGGDTFINRFTKKRKVPMFLDDRVLISNSEGVSPVNQDIQMSLIPNIGFPTYWMDYPVSYDAGSGVQQLFGNVAVQNSTHIDYNFFCGGSTGDAWYWAGAVGGSVLGATAASTVGVISLAITLGITSGIIEANDGHDVYLKGNYVHSFYGISNFLVESNYNLDLRYGVNYKEGGFYPAIGDEKSWTQQFLVPISEDNTYYYNNDYSKQNKENPNSIINNDFNQVKSDLKSNLGNRIAYSLQDNDQNSDYDGNLVYLANNRIDMPRDRGKLQFVKGLSSGKVVVVQENGASVFNSFISSQTNIGIDTVGTNELFNKGIPVQVIETDLGLGGSQTPAYALTEYGIYWVDNKRGQFLEFQNQVNNVVESEATWWFKENLPFRILEDFPEYDITNNYKYIGSAMTYDARYKRVFYTKRDVRLKEQYRGKVTYLNGVFTNTVTGETFNELSQKYFYNVSWTIAYAPEFKKFVSYYSFTPNYYVANQNYFGSGLNYSFDDSVEGFWNHLLTNKSYQVFYGKLRPHLFDFSIPTDLQNYTLNDVSYISEFRRFQTNLSSAIVRDKTFNKALIYNQNQTTGLLNLEVYDKDNVEQLLRNGDIVNGGIITLCDNVENNWNFNYFYNVARENGQPPMQYTFDNVVYKTPNPASMDYNQYLIDQMRSDFFVIRLENDKWSNYQIVTRYILEQKGTSIT